MANLATMCRLLRSGQIVHLTQCSKQQLTSTLLREQFSFSSRLPRRIYSSSQPPEATTLSSVLKQSETVPNPGYVAAKPQDKIAPLGERFVSSFPKSAQPYLRLMRLEKPIGTWLVLCPSYWSIGLATPAGTLPDPTLLLIFGAGALLMRGAGCTVNDMWDRDYDKQVTRTQNRPLARGDVSRYDALVFFGGQLSLAALLLLQLNWTTIVMGASVVLPVVLYPLMKRITYWPQFILGLTFNWGALMGWTAVHDGYDASVLIPLYGACIAWTLVYDTIYAHQDKYDDAMLGLKSTALRLGDKTKIWLAAFSTAMISQLSVAGYMAGATWPFFGSTAATAALLAHQVYTLKIDDPSDCAAKFVAHRRIGALMFAGVIASTLLR